MRACLILLAISSPAFADDKPAKTERITYRVTGLFSKDREKDLRAAFEEVTDITLVSVDFDEGEITVAFAPQKLFPGQKPERVAELVNDKLRAASSHTLGVKPRRTIARDKLTEVTIAAGGLDCKACCLAAYEAMADVDGVYQATASFKDGRVTALIDSAKTDITKLEEALKRKGVTLGKK